MRPIAAALLAAVALPLLAPEALAGDWSFERYLKQKPKSKWEGFGVGTMTHRRTSQVVQMPGQPGPDRRGSEEKQTLQEITETEYVVRVETLADGEWTTTVERQPKDKGLEAVVEDKGAETVTVGGKDYPCAKKKVTWKKGDTVDEVVVVWAHEDVGILKMKVRTETEFTMTATKLSASWTVDGVTLEGRAFEMTTVSQGMPLKGETRMSFDVPGRLVRNVLKGAQGPVTVDVLMELVAFTRK